MSMTLLMTPEMTNFTGHVHGGSLLKLLDQVAYACAARYSRSYVVTAALDQVYFKEHINVGELITLHANINYVGRSSMEVAVDVISEDLKTNQKRHVNSCFFTMVAIDEEGNSIKVPNLDINSDLEQELFNAGEARRKFRKEALEKNNLLSSTFLDDVLNTK
ncbi:MAG: acyl-CoA thioesterase [Methylococcaceae bacterium]